MAPSRKKTAPSVKKSGRTASVSRKTRETEICVKVNLHGTGESKIDTGIGFFDHMLELLAKHSLLDLEVTCRGDVRVDYHHSVEDVGLALGTALDSALGERRGIRRYGFFLLPMDECLGQCALDLGGRPFLSFSLSCTATMCRDFDVRLLEEFFRALAVNSRANIHLRHTDGNEPHHAAEALFKAFAHSLRAAVEFEPRETGIPSSKGTL